LIKINVKKMGWWVFIAGLFILPIRPDMEVGQLSVRYAPAPSQFMEIQGMPVHYRDQGKGMPVVLLHGLASSLHTWEGWVAALKPDYRIITVDLPGWGLTGPDPQKRYRIEDQVAFLAAFLDSLGIDKCVIGGNSMGGWFSWNFALAQPERLYGLILVDAAGVPSGSSAAPRKRPAYFKLTESRFFEAYVQRATPRFLYKSMLKQVYVDDDKVDRALVNRYYHLMRREGNRQAFLDRAKQRSPTAGKFDLLAELQLPTLILWGEQDSWIPPQHGEVFQQNITASILVKFPHLGHVPMEEDPENTVVPVKLFLEGLRR
jgi:pimeloyl-ACP methyl ester carboxylesterase